MGFEAASSRSSQVTADAGAVEPSARMETMMRGSTAMVTGRSTTASSSRVSTPVSLVKVSSDVAGISPEVLAMLVSGAITVTPVAGGAAEAGSFQTMLVCVSATTLPPTVRRAERP